MAEIIAVSNNKGGVGKTTVSTHLARELAKKHRVLFVDIDPQRNATNDLSQTESHNEFEMNVSHIFEVEFNKKLDIKPAIHKYKENGVEMDNFDFIPSSNRLSLVVQQIAGHARRERKLKKAIDTVKDNYDYIIIDCPPTTDVLLHNAAECAETIICPITTDKKTWDGIATTIDAIAPIKDDGFELIIVRNMRKPNESDNQLLDDFLFEENPENRYAYGDFVADTIIRERVKFKSITAKECGLLHAFDSGHVVMNDLSKLCNEVKERIAENG